MILDWRLGGQSRDDDGNPIFPRDYDVVDAATGDLDPNMDIFFADDRLQVVKSYIRDETGKAFRVSDDGNAILERTETKAIRIVRKLA